jgi:N-sulfoglucosamine sulfohydrolase
MSFFRASISTALITIGGAALQPAAAQDRPNIVVFIADDAGWRDSGAYGNPGIRTPNIDQLANDGLRVERAFLTVASCSPSRISILTGKYPHSTGAEDLHMPLPYGERIIPSYLQDQGYYTGRMQKSHLGPNGERQFQWFSRELSEAFPDFLNSAGQQPFFLWVGFIDPHRPYTRGSAVSPPHDPLAVQIHPYLADTPETRADLVDYYDEISRMDGEIGRMVAELDRRGLRENTLLIYMSDNGMPFPRAKGTNYDEGIQTPLIFSWPRRINPGQVYSAGMVSVIDLAPTFLELAGAAQGAGMEGRSIRDLLLDPPNHPGRDMVFSERNWHNCEEHGRSVRTDRYKLIRTDAHLELPLCTAADIANSPSWFSLSELNRKGQLTSAQARLFEAPRARIELYDLQEDPWELTNVADRAEYADTVRALSRVLAQWIEETGDFPYWSRVRDDNTDRVTGVKFTNENPPMRRSGSAAHHRDTRAAGETTGAMAP